MPLTAESSIYLHVLQNVSLIALSAAFTPLCFFIAVISSLMAPFTTESQKIQHQRQWRATSNSTFAPKTVLVTGVGMSKGLAIARSFYRAGHTVIGADFEHNGILVSGRFSKCLKTFYRLLPGTAYTTSLIHVIEKEKVDIWISCSGVASAIEDAEAAETIKRLTKCEPIQFGVALTKTLHEKNSFIENTKSLGLNVPETHYITCMDDALDVLGRTQLKFIMKSVGLDDSIRADMSLFPRKTEGTTRQALQRLNIGPDRPFVLQEFIQGPEFCTHSVIVGGKVALFTACPSAELLMHYRALDAGSELFQAMLEYTKRYAEVLETGHFSLDFLLKEGNGRLLDRLCPIECNPRAHTAVVLMEEAEAYLRVLGTDGEIVLSKSKAGYYWIGHDLVTRGILPLLGFLTLREGLQEFLGKLAELMVHIVWWKDGTYEVWDPWPAFWLYCGYWPGVFLVTLWTGKWWSRCNVSTTKVFRC